MKMGRPYGYLRPDIEQMTGMAEDWEKTGTRRDDLMMLKGELLEIWGLYKSSPSDKVTVVCTGLVNPVVGTKSFNIPQWYLADIIADYREQKLWCKECHKSLHKAYVNGNYCPVCVETLQEYNTKKGYSIMGETFVLYTENTGDLIEKGNQLHFRKWVNKDYLVDMVTLYRRLDNSGQLQVRLKQKGEFHTILIAEHSFDDHDLFKEWLLRQKWVNKEDLREQSSVESLFWYKAKQLLHNWDGDDTPDEPWFMEYTMSVAKKLAEMVAKNEVNDEKLTDIIYLISADYNWHMQGAYDNKRAGDEGRMLGKFKEANACHINMQAVKFVREVVNCVE